MTATAAAFRRYSFTCQPVSGPARSCLQTGLYATTSGCFRNGVPLPSHLKTLAHHFGAADSHKAVAEDMKARLVRRMVAAGEAAPEIDAAPA